jgi:hypothetical protein
VQYKLKLSDLEGTHTVPVPVNACSRWELKKQRIRQSCQFPLNRRMVVAELKGQVQVIRSVRVEMNDLILLYSNDREQKTRSQKDFTSAKVLFQIRMYHVNLLYLRAQASQGTHASC